jgi:hypothetical protein
LPYTGFTFDAPEFLIYIKSSLQINKPIFFSPIAHDSIRSPCHYGKFIIWARYAIKTGIGIFKETYNHSDESPAFGSGQGSAASAQRWGKIVPVLFNIHDKYEHGWKYEDPWKMYSSIIGMLGFVDDNNITNNGEEWETVNDIIMLTQHDAQLWNDLLLATGVLSTWTSVLHKY